METAVVSARVPIALAEKVEELAEQLGRPQEWILKEALIAWVAREEERNRLTLEGLAHVDAKRVFDHEAVQAWADGLGTSMPRPLPR